MLDDATETCEESERQTRRHFLQNISAWASAAGLSGNLMSSIQQAFAIEPEQGSSFLDAEHVVILMQENRSFDHAFGSLQGVRGFNDPRAIKLPDGNPVWVQTNVLGEKYTPFRLKLNETKSTWMGALPHAWPDQVDATNSGKHDRWLEVKRSNLAKYAGMPLTLGYFTREDIPFYYALADAFTICDQNFCSSLTGTTPNRLYFWTGTVRSKPDVQTQPLLLNSQCAYGTWRNWKTFPERLEEHAISWKIYQNELTVPTGLSNEQAAWLSNFGDSPLEWFSQFNVRFSRNHRMYLEESLKSLPLEIETLAKQIADPKTPVTDQHQQRLAELRAKLESYQRDWLAFTPENFEKLTPQQKSLHARAFCTNVGDSNYRKLEELSFSDGSESRRLNVPKGDVLYQFRKDVDERKLPTVSWLVPPERFSDHPTSAWYGQWYLAEVLNILTKNPDVWKKTIFILTYDENDGYFDHIPPFQAPDLNRAETGQVSENVDATLEYAHTAGRKNSIGLGYRVPMIIASPWSRGGCICSQIFDHTSVLQFLEKFLSHKTGRKIEETNISHWRRTICGDLTSVFQSAADVRPNLPKFLERNTYIQEIYKTKFKGLPTSFHKLSTDEVEQIRQGAESPYLARQEPGTRRSCALPYELMADGSLNQDRTSFEIRLAANNKVFGNRAVGSPFIVYALTSQGMVVRNYTVAAGDSLNDSWPLESFENGQYHFRVHGPNGFFREFTGNASEPRLGITFDYLPIAPNESVLNGNVGIKVSNLDSLSKVTVIIKDHAYGNGTIKHILNEGQSHLLTMPTRNSSGWYDFSLTVSEATFFEKRYAGRVETGQWSISDPAMGKVM